MAVPARYARNVQALSEQECRALASKHVTVVGCGGLGGNVIETLARIGVGHIRVVDGDVFEESNLNRQILSTVAKLGCGKAQAAAERVAAVNPEVDLDARAVFMTEENVGELVAGSDCVVDALDNLPGRLVLAHACGAAGIPLVYGAIAGWYGQVCTVFPGDASFASVYGAIDEDGGRGVQVREGNLPFTAACTAAFQSAECVKVLLGRPDVLRNRLLAIDLMCGCADELELC